jgi:hypothetical protein
MKTTNNTATSEHDDFELPDDVPPDPPPRVIVQAEDLHLGPAVAKPFGKSWAELHGPQPPGPGIQALDVIVAVLFILTLVLFIQSWIWAVSD